MCAQENVCSRPRQRADQPAALDGYLAAARPRRTGASPADADREAHGDTSRALAPPASRRRAGISRGGRRADPSRSSGLRSRLHRRAGEGVSRRLPLVERRAGCQFFADRNAGLFILFSVVLAGAPDDAVPPTRLVTISASALAKRFHVSRSHVVTLLRDAVDAGLLERRYAKRVRMTPRLRETTQNVFATLHVFTAAAARGARCGRAWARRRIAQRAALRYLRALRQPSRAGRGGEPPARLG